MVLAVALAMALVGCGGGDKESLGSAPATSAAVDLSEKPRIDKPEGPPPTTLQITDVVTGTGAEAVTGRQVTVKYVGVTFADGKEFDASWNRNEDFPFTLGAQAVIPGWDQGVAGMKEGGRRQLVIPRDLAYGPEGRPPVIPPNSTLIFVVDLVKVG
jgi:peptidylprolyl isomerase